MRRAPGLYWKSWRVTAGRADLRAWTIGLSSRVLDDEPKTLGTLRHEYAHLLAVDRHGPAAAGHGPLWCAAMRDIGEPPVRTHSFPVVRNASRQEAVYRCRRCGFELSRPRRLPRGRRYLHAACGGALQLVRITRVEKERDGSAERA